MPRFRKCVLVGFIALLSLLPLHEIVDPGEHLPFDDEIVVVLFSALFIVAASLTCHVWRRELFELVRAAAQRRLLLDQIASPTSIPMVDSPRHESPAHLVLCQFRV